MNEATASRLRSLQHRETRYEVVAEIGITAFRVGYATRCSKSSLLEIAFRRSEAVRLALIDAAGGEELLDGQASYSAAAGWAFRRKDGALGLRVRRSGRTERQAILEGELPLPGTTF